MRMHVYVYVSVVLSEHVCNVCTGTYTYMYAQPKLHIYTHKRHTHTFTAKATYIHTQTPHTHHIRSQSYIYTHTNTFTAKAGVLLVEFLRTSRHWDSTTSTTAVRQLMEVLDRSSACEYLTFLWTNWAETLSGMYVYVRIYTHICMCKYIHNWHECVKANPHVNITFLWTNWAETLSGMYVCMYVFVCVWVRVCLYVHACVYTHIWVYTYMSCHEGVTPAPPEIIRLLHFLVDELGCDFVWYVCMCVCIRMVYY
jgi:hypothetical protein